MEYLKNYNEFNDDLILEELNIKSLFNSFKDNSNKKLATVLACGLLTTLPTQKAVNFIELRNDIKPNQKEILIDAINKYKDPSTLSLSHIGLNHIKKEEKLKLKAYKLGDSKITIGYGHAEPIESSNYDIGDEIDIKEANRLLNQDINIASEGIRRMFNQWEKEGIYIKVTQNQFDVLVSMAFNMGISKLRKTRFIKKIKENQIDKASMLIKTTGISKKRPGLKLRRGREYNLFVDLPVTYPNDEVKNDI